MKAIIYAGIGLFSAASVYGVADFYQTSKSGVLKTLYKEESAPPINIQDRTINSDEYSRGRIEEPIAPDKKTNNEKTVSNKSIKKQTFIKKESKKPRFIKREISLEKFSRAKLPVRIDTLTSLEANLYDQ
jgi:hypothetical protein